VADVLPADNLLADSIHQPEELTIEWNSLAEPEPLSGDAGAFEIGYSAVTGDEQSPAIVDEEAPNTDRRIAELRERELESVDFYIAQGYTDIALDTLDLLQKQYGSHADIDARRARLKQGVVAEEAAPWDLEAPAPESTQSPLSPASPPSSSWNLAAETEPDVVVEPAFIALDPEPVAPRPEPTPVGKAFEPVSEPVMKVAETQVPAPAVVDAKSNAIHPGLAEVFEEFRVLEEGGTGDNGDYETHYNLGLAYKEMDLFEEALEEFQIAVGLAGPGDGTSRYLHCCNLLGHCFMQKGEPRLAVTWFNKGLKAPGHSEDEYQALRFDLGLAYEQMGNLERALEIFTEIYGVNISYRGVKEKVRDLQSRMKTNGAGSKKSKRNAGDVLPTMANPPEPRPRNHHQPRK
jgi:tetratricopeptide (TPR) repeat protein